MQNEMPFEDIQNFDLKMHYETIEYKNITLHEPPTNCPSCKGKIEWIGEWQDGWLVIVCPDCRAKLEIDD